MRTPPSQNILRTASILNSLIILVFALFLIDAVNLSYLLKFGFVYVFLITGSLKVYFMSGISGCIIEIISGEEIILQFRRIHQNAKDLWHGFLIVFVVLRLVDFALFVLFPAFRLWRYLYFSLLETVAVYALAQWVINKKYVRALKALPRNPRFDAISLIALILACLSEAFFTRASDFIHTGAIEWRNISVFIINYVHVFEFILCSSCIFESYPEIREKFSQQKEIFVINPMNAGILQGLLYWFLRDHPPFFVSLKALTPKTYIFRKFNRIMWQDRYYKSNTLVCITCFTSNCYEAYKIAKEFKKRGSKVVMGGPHVTYLPQEALVFCDSVVVGQAEGVWKEVVRDYENGTLKAQYRGTPTEDDYAQVHQELLNSSPEIVKDFLETTRGCKFRCHFCTIPALSDGKTHLQPISAIVELIRKVRPYYNNVTFIDNNIYSDPSYAKELFVALKPLGIKWQSQCTIDIAKNQETLKLARESGCVGFLFGYEVSGVSLEKSQGGKFAMAQKYREYTKIIKKAGIKIKGHFIYGFDSDNLKTLFQLWRFCFSVMPRFTVVSILTPYPGSGVYQDMLKENRIINLNWRNYGNRLVTQHPQINHHVVSALFTPVIQPFFLMTTSSMGIMLSIMLLFFPYYGLVYWFFR